MSLFDYFGGAKKSANVAKERLQIIVAHQRRLRGSTMGDFLPALQKELLDVIRKYVEVNDDNIKFRVEQADSYEVLEVNIALPDSTFKIEAK
jgi:cell division topological specificity factor